MKISALCTLQFLVVTVDAQRIFALDGAGRTQSSLYTLDPDTGAATLIGATGYNGINGLECSLQGGKLYGVDRDGNNLFMIDPSTGAASVAATISSATNWKPRYALALGPNNNLYTMGHDDNVSDDYLGLIDTVTGNATQIGGKGYWGVGNGLTYFPPSEEFLHAYSSGNMDFLDPDTGLDNDSVTLDYQGFPTERGSKNINGMGYDGASNTVYATVMFRGDSFLATVDPYTGNVTNIGQSVSKLTSVAVCDSDGSVQGDPHIQTWTGRKYDFHGVCDLVFLQNPGFQDGLGMHIHIRTKQLKQFSYVSSAVLRIGSETLEVMGDIHENLYWLNKQAGDDLWKGISGYTISYRKVNSQQHEFIVDLGKNVSIVMKTFKKFVRVNIRGATRENFATSRGLLGKYSTGELMSRDDSRVLEDTDAFGQEWQVVPADGMLFHNVDGPQAPAKCEMPLASSLRRRLAESEISEQQAEIACARVNPDDFDMCVFDVMATGDKDVVGAY